MTQRVLDIIRYLATYYTLTSMQLGYLLTIENARVVRRILQGAYADKLINKTRMEVVPNGGSTAPVYYPARKGLEFLAEALGDERYLAAPTRCPDWTKLYHWVRCADFHIFLDEGVTDQDSVRIEKWVSEFEVCDPTAREPQDKFTLFTLLREKPRLTFNPDAGFLTAFGKIKLVIYIELDRASSSVESISRSKTPAIPELLAQQTFKKHFPHSTEDTFRILHVTTTAERRELMRTKIATKKGAEIHRFVTWQDWEREKRLWAPIFYTCDKGPACLIPSPAEGRK